MTYDNPKLAIEPAAFTLREFCQRYRVGMTRTFEEINAGRLKTVKLGKKHLVHKSNAEAWLNSLPVHEAA